MYTSGAEETTIRSESEKDVTNDFLVLLNDKQPKCRIATTA